MEQLSKDLQEVSKSLQQLTRKTEQMVIKLDKLEKAQTAKKAKAKAMGKPKPARASKKKVAKKVAKGTVIDTILNILKKNRSKKGFDTATLKKKTGFNNKKIYNAINTLKIQGKVKSVGYGFYIKAW